MGGVFTKVIDNLKVHTDMRKPRVFEIDGLKLEVRDVRLDQHGLYGDVILRDPSGKVVYRDFKSAILTRAEDSFYVSSCLKNRDGMQVFLDELYNTYSRYLMSK